MFAMSQHQYAYAAPVVTGRQHNYGTSSAFSSSANPDEDWTKISDLAERRRIQNRIAQRNYRKKLKRRLEDLERRAGPVEGQSALGTASKQTMVVKRNEKQPSSKRQQPSPQSAAQQPVLLSPPPPPPQQPAKLSSQFTPPMSHEDELLFPGSFMDERERSHTPPLFSSYSTYPPPDEMMMPPYGSAQPSYGRTPVTDAYPDYLTTAATVPVTLPPLTHFSDAMNKRDTAYGGDDASLHGYMSYGFLDMNAGAYDHSNPHTPPLSHSFDHSANCSDSGYGEYPTTPLSMPGSPNLMGHH